MLGLLEPGEGSTVTLGTWAWLIHLGDDHLPPRAHLVLTVDGTLAAALRTGTLSILQAYTRRGRWHTRCSGAPSIKRPLYPHSWAPRLSALAGREIRVCGRCWAAWLRELAPDLPDQLLEDHPAWKNDK